MRTIIAILTGLAVTASASARNYIQYAPEETTFAVSLDLSQMRGIPAVQSALDNPQTEMNLLASLMALFTSHYAGIDPQGIEEVQFLGLSGEAGVIVLNGDFDQEQISARMEGMESLKPFEMEGAGLSLLFTDPQSGRESLVAMKDSGTVLLGDPNGVLNLLRRAEEGVTNAQASKMDELREGKPMITAELLAMTSNPNSPFGTLLERGLMTVTKPDDWLIRLRLTPRREEDVASLMLLSQSALLLARNHLNESGEAPLATALMNTLLVGREGPAIVVESRLSTELVMQTLDGRFGTN